MKIVKAMIFGLMFCLSSCTIYTEKQSEAASRNVYATNLSIAKERIDLAQFYSNESTKLIKPPKHPIVIHSVYEKSVNKTAPKKRVVMVPEQYKNDRVIVIGSDEFNKLLENNKALQKQLNDEDKIKADQEKKTTAEIKKQFDMNNKMVNDLNTLQKEVLKLRLAGLWKDIVIAGLLALIGVYIYVRMNSPIKLI